MKHFVFWMITIGLGTGTMAQEPAPIAMIVSLSGTVYLRSYDTPPGRPPMRLSPSRDPVRLLHDGDQLRAMQDGVVQILRSGIPLTLRAKDGWVTLHPVLATGEQLDVNTNILKSGTAGGSRAVVPLLWSPAADSWILAQDFHLRWNPPHAAETFSVTVLREDGTRLWSVDAVNSTQGGLSSQQEAEVSKLLLREQSTSERQTYSVTISSDLQGSPKTSFSVLSAAEEAQVQAELARWDKAAIHPLVRALCRVETWRAANQIYKVAEEYDRALILAPESVALLEADLAVHRQIGDLARSQELANRLRNLSSE